MGTRVRTVMASTTASVVFAGGLIGLSATPASAAEICDNVYKRKYTEISSTWHKVVASGVIDNRRSAATTRESIAGQVSASLTGSVSGEIGGSLNLAAAEISSKLGVSVEASVSIAKGKTVMIEVPARKRVNYKIGIKKREYQVYVTHQSRNCRVTNSWAKVTVADSYTETWNS
ncbi:MULTISPECIES: hypothetical protein [Streptomyces]|uniref:hypothetical protein n=1 Tax=Streptomyces TaxID=1883 RepID=UPI000F73ADD5|nr:hypothetical protein [Streptomyces sp. WAC05292]RSS95575.1 hypothetical protein EF903_04590 [Streptomyces sp. WAC05292]